MMRINSIIFNIFLLFFSVKILTAQIITFNPESDTIKAIDGCTGPVINCTVTSTAFWDSVIITPGFNTYLEYIDSLGNWISTSNCFFLISDSLNIYDYELWYIPHGTLPYFQLIPFDSSFYTYDYRFELKLFVKSQGNHIDSLNQMFITDYGLGVDEIKNNIPRYLELYPNYPNPFNSSTVVKYYLSKNSSVKISIYDITGQLIETLFNDRQLSGYHTIKWNAQHINSGVYFINIFSEQHSIVKKCVLLK